MNKKGFTLIELLAVIVILAIIALIAVPLILDVIEDSKKSAAISEAKLIVHGVENYCATESMKKQLDNTYVSKCAAGAISTANLALMVEVPATTVATVSVDAAGKVVAATTTIESNGYAINVADWSATEA